MNHWTPLRGGISVETARSASPYLQDVFEAPQSLVHDMIQCLCCLAMQMIASAFFVNQAFEASELQKTLIAFT